MIFFGTSGLWGTRQDRNPNKQAPSCYRSLTVVLSFTLTCTHSRQLVTEALCEQMCGSSITHHSKTNLTLLSFISLKRYCSDWLETESRRLPYFKLGIFGQVASPFPRLGLLISKMETIIMSICD